MDSFHRIYWPLLALMYLFGIMATIIAISGQFPWPMIILSAALAPGGHYFLWSIGRK